jgi:hypothetical protein
MIKEKNIGRIWHSKEFENQLAKVKTKKNIEAWKSLSRLIFSQHQQHEVAARFATNTKAPHHESPLVMKA